MGGEESRDPGVNRRRRQTGGEVGGALGTRTALMGVGVTE